MTKKDDCIFCRIAAGESPCHKIWENEKHLAFLTIFPNTEGFSVVITKDHQPSYLFDLDDEVMIGLVRAAKETAKLIDSKLEDVGRTGMIFEGFGVDHIHAKLFPMHGTKDMGEWKPIESKGLSDLYFDTYPGYVSSHDTTVKTLEEVEEVLEKISK